MNTGVRRSIFITIMSSSDYIEAHMRILKLHLKNKQMLEIPSVLVHCVGAEETYNPFYALVARKFCDDHRMRKAFQFTLWDIMKRLQPGFDEEDDEHEVMSMKKIVSLAKFYGALMADQGLPVAVLKRLEPDFAYRRGDVVMFVEVVLVTVLLQVCTSPVRRPR